MRPRQTHPCPDLGLGQPPLKTTAKRLEIREKCQQTDLQYIGWVVARLSNDATSTPPTFSKLHKSETEGKPVFRGVEGCNRPIVRHL